MAYSYKKTEAKTTNVAAVPKSYFLKSINVERRLKRIGIFPPGQWVKVDKEIYLSLSKADGWKGKVA